MGLQVPKDGRGKKLNKEKVASRNPHLAGHASSNGVIPSRFSRQTLWDVSHVSLSWGGEKEEGRESIRRKGKERALKGESYFFFLREMREKEEGALLARISSKKKAFFAFF